MSASTGNRTPTTGLPGPALDQIHCMDALSGLAQLEPDSIDCILTSPPYWGTRDYGTAPIQWPDGSLASLGLEPHPDLFIEHLCTIFDAAKRVLKPSGTLWVNLGDAYCHRERMQAIEKRQPSPDGDMSRADHLASLPLPVPEKSLCLIPERFVLAMVKRGWILRNRIIWHKSNHLPESVRDRFTLSWESLFLFARQPRYNFDLDAVRIPHKSRIPTLGDDAPPIKKRPSPSILLSAGLPSRNDPRSFHPKGRNPGDCWTFPTAPGVHGHPAPFPQRLCERPILAGCPTGGVVLDPFMGSGTTAVTALRLGRHFIGFELNPEYVRIANERILKTQSQIGISAGHENSRPVGVNSMKGGAQRAA